ncbi:MAG: PQQ-binding-like beta-propeller repeat protein [Calditrichaeota bacterium]|nr:PQQ-binding-like beta-propeller repeat protein [Calditrichota bacterium]
MTLFPSARHKKGFVNPRAVIPALFSVAVIWGLLSVSALMAGDILWNFVPGAGYVDTSPAVADVDGDGVQDVILATTAGRVLALDANGHKKWAVDLNQTISNPPTLAGEPLQLYVLTNSGAVICLDARSGAKNWDYRMPADFSWGMTALAAADIDGDGQVELIAGDRGGHLVCLNTNGALKWKKNTKLSFNTAPALADLDGDGRREILLGAKETPLICFSDKGRERWRVKTGDAVSASPLVYDLNGDHVPEILLGEGNGFSVYDAAGNELWHHPMQGQVHDAIAIGDVDLDGKTDIVVADLRGHVACLTEGGTLKWKASVGQRVRRSPAIADIDGDSMPEVIVGGYSDALFIFDGDGNLKEQVPLNGAMNASPTVVDFRGNGRLSVICATISDVVALSESPKKMPFPPLVLWGEYRMNSARTGSRLQTPKKPRTGITAVDYGSMHVGDNQFCVTVENPKKQRLTLEMEIRKDTGRPVRSRMTSSDSLFSGRMPYVIVGQSAENVQFVCRLKAGEKRIAQRKQTFYLVPFAKDADDLRKAIARIGANVHSVADSHYVRNQMTLLSLQWQKLNEQVKIAGTLSPLQRGELRSQFEQARARAYRLEAMTRAAVAAGNMLAAYAANPWAPFAGVDEIIEGRSRAPNLRIEAFSGEIESAAVNLANFSDHPVVLRIEPQNLLAADSTRIPFRQVLEFYEVLDVPTQSLDLSADALPKVGQARTIVLPALSVRQLWINVNTAHLPPGNWNTRIRFRTLETSPHEVFANMSVKVWPVGLTQKQPLRLCQWGYVESSMLKDMPEAALKDQVRHGTNVFVATGAFAPKATFDEHGDLGTIDFAAHDAYVRRYAPFGMILFCGYQGSLKGPAQPFSPVWIKAYKEWIGKWSRHLAELGLSHNDFAFYPVDEPGLGEKRVEEFVNYARPIRELDASLKIYADPVGEATMSELKRMAPFVDIWCPNRSGYLLHEGGKKLDFIKSTGKTVWTYECRGNAKHQSPLGYYRGQAWLAFRHGLTGIGFWSYCTSQYNPWYVPRGGQDYLLVYPGDGVVTSKRWEAVRDGVEDYNMLMQLQQAVKSAGVSPKVRRAVQKFLSTDIPAVARFCGVDRDGTLPGVEGLRGVRKVADRRWEKITQVRRKMAKLLIEIKKRHEK